MAFVFCRLSRRRIYLLILLSWVVWWTANSPQFFASDTFLPSQTKGHRIGSAAGRSFPFLPSPYTLSDRQLYLLSPQHDGDIELTPSAFIDELQRVSKINTPMDDDGTLFGTENFLKNYGSICLGTRGNRAGRGTRCPFGNVADA